MNNATTRPYPAYIQGRTVHCASLGDYLIVEFGEKALTRRGGFSYDESMLLKIASVLREYGETELAGNIEGLSTQPGFQSHVGPGQATV